MCVILLKADVLIYLPTFSSQTNREKDKKKTFASREVCDKLISIYAVFNQNSNPEALLWVSL